MLAPAGQVAASGTEGVVVTSVDPNGLASEHGFKTGDVILDVGGKKVATPVDVRNAISDAKKDGKRTVLMRLKSDRLVYLPLGPVNCWNLYLAKEFGSPIKQPEFVKSQQSRNIGDDRRFGWRTLYGREAPRPDFGLKSRQPMRCVHCEICPRIDVIQGNALLRSTTPRQTRGLVSD